ncbi:rod-binding protein [Microvirga brassicacearum]|uniref:Flagellar biosynthesis protein FlgJ n=1 Tax=Microvirga brassicacearum TaxID=2580413 RepID=A0A5N3P3K8_9HYPH|nr:rod-binding protein [Microvirga brassicacearum]KAB0264310.1 flagellar biosynthesis protein FlgJ [Microvirga brassicacearum]
MAITLPSDIVNDVARAADPARYQAAAQKLSEGASAVDGASFDAAFESAGTRMAFGGTDIYSLRNTLKNGPAFSAETKDKAAYQQFEAFVLQTFIESMLPKNAENTFGKGNAGAIWKSMMAEQLGSQIAKAGGVGIASKILASREAENHGPLLSQPVPSDSIKNFPKNV